MSWKIEGTFVFHVVACCCCCCCIRKNHFSLLSAECRNANNMSLAVNKKCPALQPNRSASICIACEIDIFCISHVSNKLRNIVVAATYNNNNIDNGT